MTFRQRLEGEQALESEFPIFDVLHSFTGGTGVHSCRDALEDLSSSRRVLAEDDGVA